MSMLTAQVENLRIMARLVRDYDYREISRALRDAADTIENLRARLTENEMCVEGWSCVLSDFSYGHDLGLLELWGKGDEDVSGFLSAENAMERIRRTL